uniref:Uncharacterized protein n=1 Tax=Lactuca sativa TaxID=4236 RepID=A0A9R1VC90_LACSA|nr:hypothetical protein LSAT_V11C600314340 [Lactuca sativa]
MGVNYEQEKNYRFFFQTNRRYARPTVKLDSLMHDPGKRPSTLSYPMMKLDGYILNLDHTNFKNQSNHSVLVIIADLCAVFNKFSSRIFGGWNILRKMMLAFCFPCFLFNKNLLAKSGLIHLPYQSLIDGKR